MVVYQVVQPPTVIPLVNPGGVPRGLQLQAWGTALNQGEGRMMKLETEVWIERMRPNQTQRERIEEAMNLVLTTYNAMVSSTVVFRDPSRGDAWTLIAPQIVILIKQLWLLWAERQRWPESAKRLIREESSFADHTDLYNRCNDEMSKVESSQRPYTASRPSAWGRGGRYSFRGGGRGRSRSRSATGNRKTGGRGQK